MYKLDLKDRKILYELDLNCRQSNAQIGKKVGLKRDVVAYRIKRLQEEGVISNFYAELDTFRLGYNVFRIYINFQYVTSDVKEEIIQYFVNNPNSWVVYSEKSEFDLGVVMWVKDIYDFYNFWDKTLDKYENYFADHDLSIYIKAIVYKKSFLLDDEKAEPDRELFKLHCGGNSIEIDEVDYKLINELAGNARAPLIDIAEKLKISSQTVNYRIKNLLKNGIIKAFRVGINYSKLGLQKFKIEIYLKDHKSKNKIIEYLATKPYHDFMNLAIGRADLEPELVVKNLDELLEIMDEINNQFSGAVKKQSFLIGENFYKFRCLPDLY